MKLIARLAAAAVTFAVGSFAMGCVDDVAPGAYYCPAGSNDCTPEGDILLSWSIDGDASGAQCASHGAAQIEVKITDTQGNPIDDWQLPCTAAATDEYLPQGSYIATAQLEDVNGKAITTADPFPFSIDGGVSSLPVDFDFEDNSFTNGS